MSQHAHERSISTTANIRLSDGNGQEFATYRELVLQENQDGTWMVYAVRPRSSENNNGGEHIDSGAIKVSDRATSNFLVDLFSLLADPGAFDSKTETP